MKTAFITGVTGQDGSYLAEQLLDRGYEVHGLVRRSSLEIKRRIEHLYTGPHGKNKRFKVHYGDMTDSTNILRLVSEIEPDEIYNLAAQSHVRVSFETPEYTANADALGALRLLEAIRVLGFEKKTKYYQASTSELYGAVKESPQNEQTPFYPRSPYGVAKLYAYWITVNYREAYGIFASNGILFNHESPRRGNSFVTKKITQTVSLIHRGKLDTLYLGNLEARRDWGYAPEYTDAMWRMMQYHEPIDLVIATGETHSVREFVESSFHYIDIDLEWEGKGRDEIARDRQNGKVLVRIDPYYYRPTEVDLLQGNPARARETIDWEAQVRFKDLVRIMMEDELKYVR